MRYMGAMGAANAANPYNLPGLPGYDPTQPTGIQPAGAVVVVPPAVPSLPTTGSPMDPTLKAQFIAAVPSLSSAQQQDLYDIGAATPQFSSARMMWVGLGAVVGGGLMFGVSRMRKRK